MRNGRRPLLFALALSFLFVVPPRAHSRNLSPDLPETPSNGRWIQLPPPSARYLHGAIYDPVRDRMIVIGGYSTHDLADDVWTLSLSGTSRWTRLEPTGTPPSARHLFSTVYDAVRDRIIVFGGIDRSTGHLGDLWELTLGDVPAWRRLDPVGPAPSPRAQHVAIFDPVRDRMIVFGGDQVGTGTGGTTLDQVWALSLGDRPEWTPLEPNGGGPSPRTGATGVYDPVRDCLLVFGGWNGRAMVNDTWSLSFRGALRWQEERPRGALPEGRDRHSAIYDARADRMVVFDGENAQGGPVRAGTWALSLHGREEWTPIRTPSMPSARMGQSAIYDPVRSRMIVYGGSPGGSSLLDEVWSLALGDTPGWANLTSSDTPPPARRGTSIVWDSRRHRFLLFGGNRGDSESTLDNEVWSAVVSDRPEWTPLPTKGLAPSGREGQSAIYDPAGDRLIVFGGQVDALTSSNEVWSLSLADAQWTRVEPAGTPPVARTTHTAIYDPTHERMVVFGGVSRTAYLDDTWALSLSGPPAWTRLDPAGARPAARFEHSAIYDPVRRRMVVCGGLNFNDFTADVWALSLDGDSPEWTRLVTIGVTPQRFDHSAIDDPARDRMVVFGGVSFSPGEQVGSTQALDLGSATWTTLSTAGPAPGNGTAIDDPMNDRMLVFGADLWALDWGEPVGRAEIASATIASTAPRVVELAAPEVTPNPTHGGSTISFILAGSGTAEVSVFDLGGRAVRTLASASFSAGRHTLAWDGRTATGERALPGVYFCEIRTDHVVSVKRIVLVP